MGYADVEMRPALAPLEHLGCMFLNTTVRHEPNRWLSAAQCNLGMRCEFDALLHGLVAVRPSRHRERMVLAPAIPTCTHT